MGRPKSPVLVSRDRLFAAAAAEFAARGYAGASVDRIARAARLNKAMIYYHFTSKAALYRAILRDMFDAVRTRVGEVAASGAAPEEKIRAYVEAIATEAEARPHFPPIWLREIAEGAGHVDAATLGYVRDVLAALGAIIADGVRAGRFQPASPLLVHGGIIAPLMFFLATAPLRQKIARAGVKGVASISRDMVVVHIQRLTLAQLEGRIT
jgi:AcrR family transcriptional regulator